MNWFPRILEAARDPDKFWREWHIERREKRLLFYVNERLRGEAIMRAADNCIGYYREKLAEARNVSDDTERHSGDK